MDTKNLYSYIKLGKVIPDGGPNGKFIDTENHSNKHFMHVYAAKHKKVQDVPVLVTNRARPKLDDDDIPTSNINQESLIELETRKLVLYNQKQELAIELDKIKIEKQKGDLIPIDLAKQLFAQHNMSIITAFNNSVNDILTQVAQKKRMSSEEHSDLKAYSRQTINKSILDAQSSTEKALKTIVDEYSVKRGQGERT